MEEHKDRSQDGISYFTFEAIMAREERHIKRLIIALVIAILGIVISNGALLYCWMQYDYSTEDSGIEVSVDGGDNGNTSYIGTRGMIINGKDNGSEMVTEGNTD